MSPVALQALKDLNKGEALLWFALLKYWNSPNHIPTLLASIDEKKRQHQIAERKFDRWDNWTILFGLLVPVSICLAIPSVGVLTYIGILNIWRFVFPLLIVITFLILWFVSFILQKKYENAQEKLSIDIKKDEEQLENFLTWLNKLSEIFDVTRPELISMSIKDLRRKAHEIISNLMREVLEQQEALMVVWPCTIEQAAERFLWVLRGKKEITDRYWEFHDMELITQKYGEMWQSVRDKLKAAP